MYVFFFLLALLVQATTANIEAFMCDENNQVFQSPAIERGQTIRICLRSDEGAIFGVESLTFLQEEIGRSKSVKAQKAVSNNRADSRRSALDCSYDNLCVVETLLLEKFFKSTDTKRVLIRGTAHVANPINGMRGARKAMLYFDLVQMISHEA